MSHASAVRGAPIDPELDTVLAEHGWILVDREGWSDTYDWPPSESDTTGDVTYLIITQPVPPLRTCPYRLCLVDGERLLYSTSDALVADLDAIEAYRFQRDKANREPPLNVFVHAALR
ncbi:hypothetical protein [Mycolicibacter sinensis]|uniref:Uncharacterized protein n=1 Tax=Mycolicibacter sinensis (strain JDM601) TaxID=875328 RepID=A0A1A2Y4A0_MYCSD|nr:hypothetical protein [Mycolicibacter sinensis]OBI32845.1 hypothetical protein A5710_14360 [Mycolicibacter sinensis]